MYKEKYLKYKLKYLKLKGGTNLYNRALEEHNKQLLTKPNMTRLVTTPIKNIKKREKGSKIKEILNNIPFIYKLNLYLEGFLSLPKKDLKKSFNNKTILKILLSNDNNNEKYNKIYKELFKNILNNEANDSFLQEINITLGDMKHDFNDISLVNDIIELYSNTLKSSSEHIKFIHYYGTPLDYFDNKVKLNDTEQDNNYIFKSTIMEKLLDKDTYKITYIKEIDIFTGNNNFIICDRGQRDLKHICKKSFEGDGLYDINTNNIYNNFDLSNNIIDTFKDTKFKINYNDLFKFLLETWLLNIQKQIIYIYDLILEPKYDHFISALTKFTFKININKEGQWLLIIEYNNKKIEEINITSLGIKKNVEKYINSKEFFLKIRNVMSKGPYTEEVMLVQFDYIYDDKIQEFFKLLFLSLKTFGDKIYIYIIPLFIIINHIWKTDFKENPLLNYNIFATDVLLINSLLIFMKENKQLLKENKLNLCIMGKFTHRGMLELFNKHIYDTPIRNLFGNDSTFNKEQEDGYNKAVELVTKTEKKGSESTYWKIELI